MNAPTLPFDNTYARDLEGLYAPATPDVAPAPKLLLFNEDLAVELGLDPELLRGETGARVFSGASVPGGASPLAQAYAGHQFGGLSPQLGDGRAVLLGELVDRHGRRRDLQLKGSGRTPFSRGGDGKAALGPVLREYLMGEAMHGLGIPTTRALAATLTGERVAREGMPPGAVLARVAASHLRVGTFEYFAIREDRERLVRLLDYTIARHHRELQDAPNKALALLEAVSQAQASLIAQWMLVGFIHGVMNTDNVAISGETIDYGPCAFMDAHDPSTVFSSIDHGGRYAYGNQPRIGQWNLSRLGQALLPLISSTAEEAVELAQPVIDAFPDLHEDAWLTGMRAKLGLVSIRDDDGALAHDLVELLAAQKADHTGSFRDLSRGARGEAAFLERFRDGEAASAWQDRWLKRLSLDGEPAARADAMDRVNPIYIPRNHLVEAALSAAVVEGDLGPLETFLGVLSRPYQVRAGLEGFTKPASETFTEGYQTFCGT